MKLLSPQRAVLALLLCLCGAWMRPVQAETVSLLASFPSSVQAARGGLVDGGDGFLYGTASAGGTNGSGSLYKIRPDGTGFAAVYTFSAVNGSGFNADGSQPTKELTVGGDGYLYGAAYYGGASGNGTAFRVHADGSGFETLHNFTAVDNNFQNADGANPTGSLALGGDGFLYGTASYGGPSTRGVVFRLKTDGTAFQPLHNFSSAGGSDASTNGILPQAGVISGGDGYFYGTTVFGGTSGFGTIYRLAADGSGFALLHSFSSSEGGTQTALTRGPGSQFYGVNAQGGANLTGLIFTLGFNGSGFQVLHTFSTRDGNGHNADGAGPYSALAVAADGTLYGTTTGAGANGSGTVFKIGGDGSGFTTLASFGDGGTTDPRDAEGALLRAGGTIYGTSAFGGNIGFGSVFTISDLPAAPGAPTNLTASASGSTISLSWRLADATETRVVVERQVSGGSFVVIATLPPGATVDTDTGLAAGTLYTYRVSAANAAGSSPPSLPASAMTAAAPPPAAGPTHILWTNTDGTASIWNYTSASGAFTQNTFGPYPGWSAGAIADGADGKTRVIWNNTDGRASFWSLDNTTGSFTEHTFGPYPGWTARAISVAPNNITHLLWTNTDGTASVWDYDTGSGTFTQNAFGPYPGWSAGAIADTTTGTRLVWNNADGRASFWNLDNAAGTFTQNTFGPYPGWAAIRVAATPDTTHLLWTNTDGTASVWNYHVESGTFTQNAFGPYPDWSAGAIADGPDGTHLIWNNTDGRASFWSLDNTSGAFTQNTFGPYSGWTARAISVAP